jgi:hypothetical protein
VHDNEVVGVEEEAFHFLHSQIAQVSALEFGGRRLEGAELFGATHALKVGSAYE